MGILEDRKEGGEEEEEEQEEEEEEIDNRPSTPVQKRRRSTKDEVNGTPQRIAASVKSKTPVNKPLDATPESTKRKREPTIKAKEARELAREKERRGRTAGFPTPAQDPAEQQVIREREQEAEAHGSIILAKGSEKENEVGEGSTRKKEKRKRKRAKGDE